MAASLSPRILPSAFQGTGCATEGSGDSCENADEGLNCVWVAATHEVGVH